MKSSIPQTTEDTSFGEITFLSDAPSYDFFISPGNLTLNGAGIINPSSTEQIFVVGPGSTLSFINSSSAGDNNAIGISNRGGTISFSGTSTAGSATFENQSGGAMNFADNSNAGNAVIVSDVGAGTITFTRIQATPGPPPSLMDRQTVRVASSSSARATPAMPRITNFQPNSLHLLPGNMSNAGTATIPNDSGSTLDFNSQRYGRQRHHYQQL